LSAAAPLREPSPQSLISTSPEKHATIAGEVRMGYFATESNYAFSGTAPLKSGPSGSRSQKSRKPEAGIELAVLL